MTVNGVRRSASKKAFGFAVCVLFLTLMALPLTAKAGSDTATPFAAGNIRLSLGFGGASAFGQNYSIFAVGAGYFIADGIEIGLDAETWSGNSPHIEQVSPQARVVMNRSGALKPYGGAFYRRTIIEGYKDQDTIGARLGVYFLSGRNAYLGAGLAEEVHLHCDRTVYSSCTETYPELLLAVLF